MRTAADYAALLEEGYTFEQVLEIHAADLAVRIRHDIVDNHSDNGPYFAAAWDAAAFIDTTDEGVRGAVQRTPFRGDS